MLAAIITGLIIGAIAKLLMPGRDPGGCIITILLGLAGSIVATYLGQALGLYHAGEAASWIGGVIGAMLLLLVYRILARPRP
jgi:uncharacterized membrane protein YeaQ/YmgE (transglycosylase-associated protein family)